MTDPITDMFNRIKNGEAVHKETVDVPFSKMKQAILEILEKEGFVGDVKKKGRVEKKLITVDLKYDKEKQPTLAGFKRISKPGQRVYKKYHEIKPVKNGYGLAVISTSRGIMNDKEVRRQKLGGEVLVEVW